MIIQRILPVLLCGLMLLAGCAEKTPPKLVTVRFPEQPPATLAKTPEQCVPDNLRQAVCAVNGGWGYGRKDAFTFTVPAPQRKKIHPTIPAESRLVQARNEVEFSDTPAQGQRYAVVDYGTISRTLSTQEGRMYAIWRGEVRVVSEAKSPALYRELVGRPLHRRGTSAAMAQALVVSREYWFDISETFGRLGGAAPARASQK